MSNKLTIKERVRTACVVKHINGRTTILAADVIPNEWPDEPYTGKTMDIALTETMGIYSFFINIGAGTLFTALGILLAIVMGLGIQVGSFKTLYKAAFVLGIVETILLSLPIVGFWVRIALETVALFITDMCVQDFRVDWSAGYKLVAAGALIILVTRMLLNWVLLALIAAWVF